MNKIKNGVKVIGYIFFVQISFSNSKRCCCCWYAPINISLISTFILIFSRRATLQMSKGNLFSLIRFFFFFFFFLLLSCCHICKGGDFVSKKSLQTIIFNRKQMILNVLFKNALLEWRNHVCQQRLWKCSQLLSRNICSGARGTFFLWAVQTADNIMNEKPLRCLTWMNFGNRNFVFIFIYEFLSVFFLFEKLKKNKLGTSNVVFVHYSVCRFFSP